MITLTLESYLYADPDHTSKTGYVYKIRQFSSCGLDDVICLGKFSFTVEVPDHITDRNFLVQQAITTLENAQAEAQAEADLTYSRLQKKIDALRMLEYIKEVPAARSEEVDDEIPF